MLANDIFSIKVSTDKAFYYSKDNAELLGYSYDNKTNKTRTINKLIADKKSICFDFVNYLYNKYNKTGKCYFAWFNNKAGNTHTIYITEDGYYIEATPPASGKLTSIYCSRCTAKDVFNDMAKRMSTGYWKDSPRYRVCEYIPENKIETIDSFIDKRWTDGGWD